jgi:hypothetical protein
MKLQLRSIIGDWRDSEAGETNFSRFYHSVTHYYKNQKPKGKHIYAIE